MWRRTYYFATCLLLAALAEPITRYISDLAGQASDSSLGLQRNWAGATLLELVGLLSITFLISEFASKNNSWAERTLKSGIALIFALGCIGSGIALLVAHIHPGLWGVTLIATITTALAFGLWFECLTTPFRPNLVVNGEPVFYWFGIFRRFLAYLTGAAATTILWVWSLNEALIAASMTTPLSVAKVAPTPADGDLSHADLILLYWGLPAIGGLVACWMTHVTRILLSREQKRAFIIGACVSYPCTIAIAASSGMLFIVAGVEFYSLFGAPFAIVFALLCVTCNVALIYFIATGRLQVGINELVSNCISRQQAWESMARYTAMDGIADREMEWLISIYDKVALPREFDVYEALGDISLRVCDDDVPVSYDGRPLVLRKGDRLVAVAVPYYARAPERRSAARYLTRNIEARCISGDIKKVSREAVFNEPPPLHLHIRSNSYRIKITLRNLLEGFRFLGNCGPIESEFTKPCSLEGLRSLDVETAEQALACAGKWPLAINSIEELSVNCASVLGNYRGRKLELDGLKTLTPEAAQCLFSHGLDADLSLNGLRFLSADVANWMATYKGRLSLKGLTTLANDSAEVLAAFRGIWLDLGGLETLSGDAAAGLRINSAIRMPEGFCRP